MHRASVHTVSSPEIEKPHPVVQLVGALFLLAYFVVVPILTMIIVNWVVYYFTADIWFHEEWMMPTLMLFSTFIGGVLIRQKIEDGRGGLGLFLLGIIGLALFAYLTYIDIHKLGGVFSQFMPKYLRPTMTHYAYILPGVGVLGMLFYKYFSLKNYS